MSFFTQNHFSLLKKWAKKKYDKNDPKHRTTRSELADIYILVEDWAKAFQKKAFPNGDVTIRKSPVNQGQRFETYMWAKVYPLKASPKALAYTVGINTSGLDLKIDTVGLDEKNEFRKKYLSIRGDFSASGIVSQLPVEKAIELDFEQLIDFSINELAKFEMSYEKVSEKIGLSEINEFPYIAKCNASSSFNTFLSTVGKNKKAFNDAIKVVHEATPNFDLYNIDKAASCLRFGNKESVNKRGKVAGYFRVEKGQLVLFFSKRYDRKQPIRVVITEDLEQNSKRIKESIEDQMSIFKQNNLLGSGRWPIDYEEVESAERLEDEQVDTAIPLNQILYGPPGTGKTYHSIQAAVKAAEPELFDELDIDEQRGATTEQREELKKLYEGLFNAGRIRFVTFHQSYGYEEFVEGLSAKTEGEQLSYFEKDGVFKLLCNKAKENFEDSQKSKAELTDSQKFDEALESFKLAMFDDVDAYTLTDAVSITSIEDSGFRYGGEGWKNSHIMKFVDLKSLYLEGVENRQGIKSSGSVSGLAKQHASYFIRALDAIKSYTSEVDVKKIVSKKQNYVLIIDEINRGNISKIFGELITLIEPSKRFGRPEAIEVTLPYSGGKFSVPDNFYIIGTMNTADRSLALMDTALRRRFDFVEMMPDYKVLQDEAGKPYVIEKDGLEIDLVQLLQKLNQRISALYDREHQLGHAFFISVVKALTGKEPDKALAELKNCFQNKIIPLLAEYFFEDWQKIRLVLGDNQKPDNKSAKNYQLVKQSIVDYQKLFGDDDDAGEYAEDIQDFALIETDCDLWLDARTYISMYDVKNLPMDEGQ